MIQDFQNFQKPFPQELKMQSYLPGNFVALNIVLPGDVITMDKGYMNGYGTFEDNAVIYSSLVGTVEKTNKLLLVKPLNQKYQPEIGDVIIGKVTEIANKKWHLDINSACTAFLQLNSTFIPEQVFYFVQNQNKRKKTEQDELKMREMFKEGELICAEVHSLNNDKTINLHTRNIKYGKLNPGIFVKVNNKLIKRQKHHFVAHDSGVKYILSHNGNVWIYAEDIPNEKEFAYREAMALIRNIVVLLNEEQIEITTENINKLYEEANKQNLKHTLKYLELLIRDKQMLLLQDLKGSIEEKIPSEINKLIKQGDYLGFN